MTKKVCTSASKDTRRTIFRVRCVGATFAYGGEICVWGALGVVAAGFDLNLVRSDQRDDRQGVGLTGSQRSHWTRLDVAGTDTTYARWNVTVPERDGRLRSCQVPSKSKKQGDAHNTAAFAQPILQN